MAYIWYHTYQQIAAIYSYIFGALTNTMTEQHKANSLAAISAFQNKSKDAIPLSFQFSRLCQKSGVKSQNKHEEKPALTTTCDKEAAENNFLCCINLMTHAFFLPCYPANGAIGAFLSFYKMKGRLHIRPNIKGSNMQFFQIIKKK